MASDAADLDLLIEAVRHAATVAERYDPARVAVRDKADGSKVSDADLAADAALAAVLRPARPDYGWLSEEGDVRVRAGRVFVCDPIDGTNAFLRGENVWTVVAAVVDAGRPMVAAILRPRRGVLYTAISGGGAFRDGRPIRVSTRTALAGASVAAPGPLFRDAALAEAGVARGPSVASLALRLAKVAEGAIDAAVTKAGAHHWDLAAADLILHEAGGSLTSLSGMLLSYDGEATAHGPTIGGPPDLAAALRARAAPYVAA